jgi:sec-independent protein translocase protein TatB
MLSSVLLFLDISGGEFMLIMLVALLVLGPQKLGDAARKAGKMMNEVKRVSSDFTEQLKKETSGLTEEVQGIRETIRDTATNLKDQLLKEQEEAEVKKAVTPSVEPEPSGEKDNTTEPVTEAYSSDIYHISTSETVTPPYTGYNNECHPSELEINTETEVKPTQPEASQPIESEAAVDKKNTSQTKDQQ